MTTRLLGARPAFQDGTGAPGVSSRATTAGYDAFISYSHAVDGALAPALQAALHRFAKPWYRLRALRIFQDEASLGANTGLWTSIQQALSASDYFLLLASPDAARSPWVGRECEYWSRSKPAGNLLVALTDGEIVWDQERGDFDWDATTALPPALAGVFSEEPLLHRPAMGALRRPPHAGRPPLPGRRGPPGCAAARPEQGRPDRRRRPPPPPGGGPGPAGGHGPHPPDRRGRAGRHLRHEPARHRPHRARPGPVAPAGRPGRVQPATAPRSLAAAQPAGPEGRRRAGGPGGVAGRAGPGLRAGLHAARAGIVQLGGLQPRGPDPGLGRR